MLYLKIRRTKYFLNDGSLGYDNLDADVSNNQPPQLQPDRRNMVEQCAIDVGGNQPPQLQSRSQPKSQPDPQPQPQQLLTDVCGYQPPWSQPQLQSQSHPHPQQFLADVCGYQPPESQPQFQPMQPQIWTWKENKAFESFIVNCFQDAKHNRWELVAALERPHL
ncbi:hypothetical protein AHAS_Ahas18G0248300 [Arachis hypogaea]